ncbi:MAG TPA: 4Fe-4S dicluster domain-containing protein [Acidothermaceae bacterium]
MAVASLRDAAAESSSTCVVFDVAGLQALIDELIRRGYTVVGPTVREGGIVAAEIHSIDDLPRGVADHQQPGEYRLSESGADEFFGFASGATSWKPVLFPPRRMLWRHTTAAAPVPEPLDDTPRALLGVRACDLRAIEVQDRVFADRAFIDPDYVSRRRNTFIVAVTCGHPSQTCFCTSMGGGPKPSGGYDVLLTELVDDEGRRFVVDTGTAAGADVVAAIASRPASSAERTAADDVAERAAARIERRVDTDGLRDRLYEAREHPQWDDIASRCLSCGNCTLVCPTCFCVTTNDVEDLAGPVGRERVWDSCFVVEYSYIHGGPIRRSTQARYRQWLTHKFASWIDQFGTSGCVGCGRCVTWCPVGIDITEELARLSVRPATASDKEGR